MQTINHISIPEPCHQNWDEMATAISGRNCIHCCKTVTDFTMMSNQQIMNILANNNDTCGRIGRWQLNSIAQQMANTQTQGFSWKGWVVAVGLFLTLPATKALAQRPHHKEYLIKAKRPPGRTDSLKAYYIGYRSEEINFAAEVRPMVIKAEAAELISLVGGIVAVARVSEPSPFFKEGHYQSIYDMLQSVIKLSQ